MNGTLKSRRKPQWADAVIWLFGVRPNWERVTEREAAELDELLGKAAIPHGFDLGTLSGRERTRLEQLVGKAGGVDLAEQGRREAAAEKEREKEAAMRRRPFNREETTNYFRAVFAALENEDLWCDDAALLTVVLAMFASGKTLASRCYFTGAGDSLVLHLNMNFGLLGSSDGAGSLGGWKQRLLFLSEPEQGWLQLEPGRGPERAFRLGPRLREALAGAAAPLEAEVVA